MKFTTIERSLVEQVAVFLQALPSKQQSSSSQASRVLAQLAKTTHDEN